MHLFWSFYVLIWYVLCFLDPLQPCTTWTGLHFSIQRQISVKLKEIISHLRSQIELCLNSRKYSTVARLPPTALQSQDGGEQLIICG